jgi:hypothetical protein
VSNLKNPRKLDFFNSIIENAFLGNTFTYKRKSYHFEPTVVTPYDFLRKIETPSSEFERFLKDLDNDFKATAKTEMYRKEGGWISLGISANRIKNIEIDEKNYLIPVLSPPSVGIDTSGIASPNKKSTLILICCLDNVVGGISYLERHLNIPKEKRKNEFKWSKTSNKFRIKILENLNILLKISSCGALAINTNTLISPVGSLVNIFRDLIDGCFTGYEKMPRQNSTFREALRQRFFKICNNIPIYCDSDFRPLSPDKIVRLLVKTLSKVNGKLSPCLPLHVPLESEESQPIQIADVIVGAIGMKIRDKQKPPNPFSYLFFDNRKISAKARKRGKFAKAYYWFRDTS